MSEPTRLLILANRFKPEVVEALDQLRPWFKQRARIVGEPDLTNLTPDSASDLPPADLAIVFGGDGTLLAQARNILQLQIPMLGVNFGKLGFLAEFSVEELQQHWQTIIQMQCPQRDRVMLDVLVFDAAASDCQRQKLDMAHCTFQSTAMNDAVIHAGEPFRMIDLHLTIDPSLPHSGATQIRGDGVIVATPSGSTAHNLGAGGPIVSPGVDAFCINAISPHSLAFRPIVCGAEHHIAFRIAQANAGTTLVIDGQITRPLAGEQQVYIRRHPMRLRLLGNPAMNYWKMLNRKMNWARGPKRE